jgi:uncharacterized protein
MRPTSLMTSWNASRKSGLTFYRTGSLAQSRQLAEDDPAVLAGRLTVEIMTWYCPPGTMVLPGRPVSVP